MTPRLLVQTALFLIVIQWVLGAMGYLLDGWPPVGLPLTIALAWLISRTAVVLRDEILWVRRKRRHVVPLAVAGFVVAFWQIPALIAVPLWAPHWLAPVWQGAMLPVLRTVGLVFPDMVGPATPWLWFNGFWQAALFMWTASRPDPAAMAALGRYESARSDGMLRPDRRRRSEAGEGQAAGWR